MEIIAALSILVVVLAGGAFWLYRRVRFLTKIIHDLKTAPPDWANHNAQALINTASQQANSIVTQAHVEGIKLATQEAMETKLYEQQYHEKLELLMKQLSETVTTNMEQVRLQFETYVKTAESKLEASQGAIESEMRTKVNGLLLNFEENLASFLANSEQKSFDAVNLELKSAKQMIESYKTQQLGLIDENIVAILERTLQLVLNQKLSLTNQVDLVYESLEQAKSEKFFG